VRKFYYFIFFLIHCKVGLAQDPFFTHFGADEGLVALANFNVVQDNKNLIWVGSEEGLFYYDGKQFTLVKSKQATTKGVFNLQKDENGELWCSTISGHIFKVKNKKLVLFKDLSSELKGAFAHLIVLENNIFFLSQTESFQLDKQTAKIKKRLNAQVSKVIKTKTGFYYYNINSLNTLTYVEEVNNEIHTTILRENKDLDFGNFQSLKLFGKSVLIRDRDKKCFSINERTKELDLIQLPNPLKQIQVYTSKDLDGVSWLLTSKGIIQLTKEKSGFVIKNHFFKKYQITDLFVDNEGNLWCTTLYNGVIVIPNLAVTKQYILSDDDDIIFIEKATDNLLLLGTQKGFLVVYNISDESFEKIEIPNSRPVNRIYYNSDSNKAFISTNGTNSYVYSLTDKSLTDYGTEFTTAKGFAEVSKDSLLYLSYRGVLLYKNIQKNTAFKEIARKRPISVHYDTKNKQSYISYIDGTLCYNNQFEATPVKYHNKRIIFSSFAGTQKSLWGLSDNKLYLLRNTQIKDSLTVNDGLLNSQIRGVLGEGNQIWIVTEKGVQKFNELTREITTIKLKDENSIKFKQPVYAGKSLWIPGNSYLCKLSDKNKDLFKKNEIPDAYISEVIIGGKTVSIEASYLLPYNTNDITFQLRANGFLANKQHVFQYKLKGFDNDWQTAELNEDIVRYIGIPSGKYEFLIRTKALHGEIGKIAIPTLIQVKKPFWDTWWFYVLVLLLAIIALIFYFRFKIKIKEEEGQRELEKVILDSRISKLKLENLRSQMNPHFIFNSLGAIQDYVMKNEKYLASDYLVKFSRLIRLYLNHSRLNTITLKEELHSLEIYIALEQLRFENKFNVQLNVDQKLNQEQVQVPPLFIQPFVENAIKHGLVHKSTSGNLWIDINSISKNVIQITVEDDGIGREKSAEINKKRRGHQSFAVSATEERINLYKKEKLFEIEVGFKDKFSGNKKATGTKVIITIKKTKK
jgi:ligand-binding sensor domain-containing protein